MFQLILKAGCSVFTPGFIEQVFFLKPKIKKLAQIRLVVFGKKKTQKTTHFNSEKMTSPSRRL